MADTTADTVLEEEHPTGELRLDETAQVPAVNSDGADDGSDELSPLFEGEPDDWPTQGPAKGLRLPWPVAGLLVLLLAFGGLWAGAYLQRSSSTSSSASSPFGGSFSLPSGAALGRGTGGASGFPGASTSGTSGTVTDIIGSTLYVTTASGSLVAVNVGTTTTVNRNAKSSLSALQPGDTVTVQGTKAKDGTVAASSVSATQAGVSSGLAGFGGGGFPGAASGSAAG
ncbi:MAG: hypothetical protein ABSF84_12510 [Acidimicrobiales bacterium]